MKIVNEEDIKKVNNAERCEILLQIIRRQAVYKNTLGGIYGKNNK